MGEALYQLPTVVPTLQPIQPPALLDVLPLLLCSDLGGVHPSKSRHLFNKQGFGSCSKLEACVIPVLQDLRAN